jgi:tetratricopeptide (TPR) repeat protein
MPRANPTASFEVATKHLFRHLHNPGELRKNPLTRFFFEESDSAIETCKADRVAVERVHDTIRAAARRFRECDLQAGLNERAHRGYEIVDGCLGRKTVSEIARRLGVSSTQYYRERAQIATRIAAFIRDGSDRVPQPSIEPFDEFRYAMTHAARLTEIGDTQRALDSYRRLIASIESPARVIEALCECALVHLGRGEDDAAARMVQRAERMLGSSDSFSPREREIAGAHTLFVRALSTWATQPAHALTTMADAVAKLDRLPGGASDRSKTLCARILFEYGEGLSTFHRLRDAVEALSRAARLAASCHNPPSSLVLRIEIVLRLFRSSMLVDPFGWEPLHQRLQAMLDLARRARATGSVDLTLSALNAVSQLHALAGDAPAAYDAMRSALSLAKYSPTREVFSEVSVRMARTLVYTPLWREVPNILRYAGAPATIAVETTRRALEAEYALRCGKYREVSTILRATPKLRRPYMAMLAAQAAHALGESGEARAMIEPAVPAVERSDLAFTIEQTYRIAGRITRDRRYLRKADEIDRVLSG